MSRIHPVHAGPSIGEVLFDRDRILSARSVAPCSTSAVRMRPGPRKILRPSRMSAVYVDSGIRDCWIPQVHVHDATVVDAVRQRAQSTRGDAENRRASRHAELRRATAAIVQKGLGGTRQANERIAEPPEDVVRQLSIYHVTSGRFGNILGPAGPGAHAIYIPDAGPPTDRRVCGPRASQPIADLEGAGDRAERGRVRHAQIDTRSRGFERQHRRDDPTHDADGPRSRAAETAKP